MVEERLRAEISSMLKQREHEARMQVRACRAWCNSGAISLVVVVVVGQEQLQRELDMWKAKQEGLILRLELKDQVCEPGVLA
jgi:hypothetical protein